ARGEVVGWEGFGPRDNAQIFAADLFYINPFTAIAAQTIAVRIVCWLKERGIAGVDLRLGRGRGQQGQYQQGLPHTQDHTVGLARGSGNLSRIWFSPSQLI